MNLLLALTQTQRDAIELRTLVIVLIVFFIGVWVAGWD